MTLAARLHRSSRVERLAARDRLTSTTAVARTHRYDGRTVLVGVRDADGWRRVRGHRWTAEIVETLRDESVTEVLLRRGVRWGRLPLAWLPRQPPR